MVQHFTVGTITQANEFAVDAIVRFVDNAYYLAALTNDSIRCGHSYRTLYYDTFYYMGFMLIKGVYCLVKSSRKSVKQVLFTLIF